MLYDTNSKFLHWISLAREQGNSFVLCEKQKEPIFLKEWQFFSLKKPEEFFFTTRAILPVSENIFAVSPQSVEQFILKNLKESFAFLGNEFELGSDLSCCQSFTQMIYPEPQNHKKTTAFRIGQEPGKPKASRYISHSKRCCPSVHKKFFLFDPQKKFFPVFVKKDFSCIEILGQLSWNTKEISLPFHLSLLFGEDTIENFDSFCQWILWCANQNENTENEELTEIILKDFGFELSSDPESKGRNLYCFIENHLGKSLKITHKNHTHHLDLPKICQKTQIEKFLSVLSSLLEMYKKDLESF